MWGIFEEGADLQHYVDCGDNFVVVVHLTSVLTTFGHKVE